MPLIHVSSRTRPWYWLRYRVGACHASNEQSDQHDPHHANKGYINNDFRVRHLHLDLPDKNGKKSIDAKHIHTPCERIKLLT